MRKKLDIGKAISFFYAISMKDKAEWVLRSLVQQGVFFRSADQ